MGKAARNHHYLPQCYLKGFGKSPSKKACLYVFDVYTGKSFCTCPRNVGALRDFNTVDVEDHPLDVIEKVFSQFESQAAKVLEKMRYSHVMPEGDDFNVLMNLIAQMAIRNPYIRETIKKIQTDVVERITDLALSTKERWESITHRMKEAGEVVDESISYEELKRFHDEKRYTIEIANFRNIKLEMAGINAILPTLANRKWTLVVANEKSGYFIGSDRPVTLIWTSPKLQDSFCPPGYGMKRTEIVFPVMKELALVGTFEGEDRVIDANKKSVALLNSRILSLADKQVFSSEPTFQFMACDNSIYEASELKRFLTTLPNQLGQQIISQPLTLVR